MIGVHPKALLEFDQQSPELQATIAKMIAGYDNPREYYVAKLTEGIATLGAAFWPERVIVRMSDFKSNEYANLVGGRDYEPHEENPMIGFRGAARYIADSFRPALRWSVKLSRGARRHGVDQRRGDDPLRAHSG
ncbi:putative PEP-binding protein [Escherichia coli]